MAITVLHAQNVPTAKTREIAFPAAVVEEFQRSGSVFLSAWNLNLRLAEGIKPVVGLVGPQEILVIVDEVIIGFAGESQTASSTGRSDIESVSMVRAGQTRLGRDLIVINTSRTAPNRSRPLLVVDGVVVTGEAQDIPREKIESIEVLKGAAATQLYGTRAAAGVIVITTKR